MDISIISFTEKGYELSNKLKAELLYDDHNDNFSGKISVYTKCHRFANKKAYVEQSIEAWAHLKMINKECLIFIGACGIAVRAIASSVENKLTDSPVIVIDELGSFVIPILSGHVGRANEIAKIIADKIGATPVITTATDINNQFAVDVFAGENDLAILNKDGIAKVSARVLSEQELIMSIDRNIIADKLIENIIKSFNRRNIKITDYPPTDYADIIISEDENMTSYAAALYLKPKQYVIGIGCRKNTPFDKIDTAIQKSLTDTGLSLSDICRIASIDVKKDEPGILNWSSKNRIDFVTYPAERLMMVEGEFSSSEFVKAQVGVDNVCERAAAVFCMENGGASWQIVYKKHAYDSVTVSIAKCIR